MAIKIGGTSIINDDGSISNVGIVTIGLGGTTGKFKVGTGVTIDGAGNAYFDGQITVNGGITYLVGLNSMSPQNTSLADSGSYGEWNGVLRLYFDSPVQASAGSTLTVSLRRGSSTGTQISTAGVSSISYPGSDTAILDINFPGITTALNTGIATYYPIIPKGIIKFIANNADYAGNYSGDPQANSLSFQINGNAPLGAEYRRGYLICKSGGVGWLVSPYCSELSRNFYDQGHAATCAQTVTGCTGWFTTNRFVLENPGRVCKQYWDCYSLDWYWSNTEHFSLYSWGINFANDATSANLREPCTYCVRSFRCVTY